jgi:hypothetical protein
MEALAILVVLVLLVYRSVGIVQMRQMPVAVGGSATQPANASGQWHWRKGGDATLATDLLALASMMLASLAAYCLCSYYSSVHPTKQNLKTHLDWVLVISMAGFVNLSVGG